MNTATTIINAISASPVLFWVAIFMILIGAYKLFN